MKNNKLCVGIAGYGVVGKRRRNYIDKHSNLITVAISDITLSANTKEFEGVKAFKNYNDLLNESLDVLFVCLPNFLSPEVTIKALKKGIHVFCEKPPGRNVVDIEQVINEEKLHPELVLKYGFNHRYHDSVMQALQLIKSSDMGDVVNIRGIYGKSKVVPFSGGWRAERIHSGGGILLDQGIHMVDLIRLFGGEFQEVKSFISNDFWKHDVEDNAYAIMRNTEGKVAMLHSSATQWEHRFSLVISLSKGSLELSGILTGSKSYGEETLTIRMRDGADHGTVSEQKIKYLDDHSWKDEINEFASAIIENKPLLNGTSLDALETMKLVYQIYLSDKDWCKKYNIKA